MQGSSISSRGFGRPTTQKDARGISKCGMVNGVSTEPIIPPSLRPRDKNPHCLPNGSPSKGETRKLKWESGEELGEEFFSLSLWISLAPEVCIQTAECVRLQCNEVNRCTFVQEMMCANRVSALNRTYLLEFSLLNRASFTSIDPEEVDYSTQHESIRFPESGSLGQSRCSGPRPQPCPGTRSAGLCASPCSPRGRRARLEL